MALAFAVQPALAQDGGVGPFGVEMGSDPTDYGCVERDEGIFRCSTLPRHHPDVDFYTISAEKGVGTCRVAFAGKTISANSRGTALQKEVARLSGQLAKTYGEPTVYDFLSSGSIWDRPSDWMMGLLEEDRTLAHFWSDGPYKAQVTGVMLQAKALNSDEGYVSISFEFANLQQCAEARTDRESSVF